MEQIIAIIADIHGNSWALDTVLADIMRRGVAQIVNLGDSVYGSLDPAGTAQRLIDVGITSIVGNQDRDVFAPSEVVRRSANHEFVIGRLSAAQIDWMRDQPPTCTIGDLFCCHGTPASDEAYLLETVTEHGVFLSDSATIQARLGDIQAQVIVCGHSHVSHVVWLPDGRLVVNPGSVGVPAYQDELPYPHVMEAGSPHARYAILTRRPAGWAVEQIALPYPWAEAAAVARRNGRADRATWIETGRASL